MNALARPFVAFISYSHRDTAWAAWLQKALERYRLPGALAKETGLDKRVGKVFRDREELATGQNLGDHLLEALDNSDNLIVICSPNAVNSQWVSQEIEYFKSIGRGDRIFCLLVEGGAEALPAPLLTDVAGNPLEPLAADPRETGDGKRLAKLKLVSGMLGVKLDQLTRREQARQNQLRAIYTTIVGSLLVMGAVAYVSIRQEQFERESAMANAANMVEFAETIANQIDMASRAKVNNQLIEYLERSGTDNLDLETTRYLAQAYQQLGIAKLEQGTDERSIVDVIAADQAVENFARSNELYELVLEEHPEDPDAQFDHGIADFWIGYTQLRRGNLVAARMPLEQYAQVMRKLYGAFPDNSTFVIEQVYAEQVLLILAIESSNSYTSELADVVARSTTAAQQAAQQLPTMPDVFDAKVAIFNLAASAFEQECRYHDGAILEFRHTASDSALRALELEPRSRFFKRGASDGYSQLAHTYDVLGRINDAREAYLNAYRLRVELADTDPTNEFAATQVLKSRLDIFKLRTHADDGQPLSFTETQALTDITSPSFREATRKASIEHVWLLYMAEAALMQGNKSAAERHLQDMIDLLVQTSGEWPEARWMTATQGAVITKSLDKSFTFPSFDDSPSAVLPGKDCQSRTTRWLWYAAQGSASEAEAELAGIRASGLKPSVFGFYEALIGELE